MLSKICDSLRVAKPTESKQIGVELTDNAPHRGLVGSHSVNSATQIIADIHAALLILDHSYRST